MRSLLATLLLLGTGCTATQTLLPDLPPPPTIKPGYLTVGTQGLEIFPKGKDPAWRLEHRKSIKGPFLSDQVPIIPRDRKAPNGPELVKTWSEENPPKTGTMTRWPSREEAKRAANHSEFTRIFFEYLPTAPGEAITLEELEAGSDAWAEKGAVHVWVRVPWFRRPLHGLLVLCKALNRAEGREVKRTWSIEVTKKQAVAAARGKVVLACDPYDAIVKVKGVRYVRTGPAKAMIDEEEFYQRIRVDGVTWALWLSKESFPGAPVKEKRPKAKDIEVSDR
jgi:hypothetical protein